MTKSQQKKWPVCLTQCRKMNRHRWIKYTGDKNKKGRMMNRVTETNRGEKSNYTVRKHNGGKGRF